MITVEDLLQELEQETQTTRRVLESIPEDKLAWRPHERSRSLGELALSERGRKPLRSLKKGEMG